MDISELTKPCEHCGGTGVDRKTKGFSHRCYYCKDGQVLTEEGQRLLDFIEQFANFADKDHSHTIS